MLFHIYSRLWKLKIGIRASLWVCVCVCVCGGGGGKTVVRIFEILTKYGRLTPNFQKMTQIVASDCHFCPKNQNFKKSCITFFKPPTRMPYSFPKAIDMKWHSFLCKNWVFFNNRVFFPIYFTIPPSTYKLIK